MAQRGRTTIADVARKAGVSSSAVSYALNGKAGVSPATRDHILDVARSLGWQPNRAAQSLSVARSRLLGLILDGDPSLTAVEPYFMKLITGITQECERADYSLVLRHARDAGADLPVIRKWIASGAVDGLILTNIETTDARLGLLEKHPDFPVVAVASQDFGPSLPTVWSQDEQESREIVDRLAGLGHRTIARVSGPASLTHSRLRDETFARLCARRSIGYSSVFSDYTPAGGREATERLLAGSGHGSGHPTAIIYDNDVMAVSGLAVLRARGLRMPQDVSVVCWDDSILCETSRPAISAIRRDTVATGRLAASMLLERITAGTTSSHRQEGDRFVVRESVGPAPGI